jgi:excisionase family DNA binding protein
MNTDLIEGATDAAAFTGLSRRKIYRLAEQGHVPVIRKGRRLYFRKSELERAFMGVGAVEVETVQ